MDDKTDKVHPPLTQALMAVADAHAAIHAAVRGHASTHAQHLHDKRQALALQHSAKKLLEGDK